MSGDWNERTRPLLLKNHHHNGGDERHGNARALELEAPASRRRSFASVPLLALALSCLFFSAVALLSRSQAPGSSALASSPMQSTLRGGRMLRLFRAHRWCSHRRAARQQRWSPNSRPGIGHGLGFRGGSTREIGTRAVEIRKGNEEATAASNFIKTVINQDLESGATNGLVATRFPPEPNGYLHIGHAKSICLNFGLAQEYKGKCNLRFDDTNPLTEDVEYVNSIVNDVKWLGFTPDKVLYTSDYFQALYDHAVTLIKQGNAFVDTCTPEEISNMRGTVKVAGTPSPHRDRTPEENLELFEKMRQGEFKDGEAVLRAKIDMANPNMLLRDPVLYRIKHSPPHHRSGSDWCIYPMYDFAHPLSDAIEGITHSICTLEFDVHRPLYDWLVDNLYSPPRPHQYEMGRLNLDHTITSKRKLLQLVNEKKVRGWDDPRMPTIAGIRRRGIPPGAIRRFCEMVGVARSESRVELAMLEAAIREELNEKTPRIMAVLNPLKVVITNWEEGRVEEIEAPLFPESLAETLPEISTTTRKVPLTREIFIEKDDFMLDPPKKFFRLKPGGEVRLRYGYIIKCDEVIKDPKTGEVVELRCSYDPNTKSGTQQTRKVKGTIHWVSADEGVPAEVRVYESLLTVPSADEAMAEDPSKSLMDLINPNSEKAMSAIIEPFIQEDLKDENRVGEDSLPRYQFERQGFFALDAPTGVGSGGEISTDSKIVINRIVGLRDTWIKEVKKAEKDKASGRPERGRGRAQAPSIPEFNQVELRVGKIVKVWPHPDADRLWCEEIDLGESTGPRTIVSGLRDHYTDEQLVGKKVVVVANLKPSKLRGVESKGMVLAASNESHTVVKLVEPPADADVGKRLSASGIDISEFPLPENPINPKAKTSVWPKVVGKMRVDENGVPMYDGKPLEISGIGACTVEELKDAAIG